MRSAHRRSRSASGRPPRRAARGRTRSRCRRARGCGSSATRLPGWCRRPSCPGCPSAGPRCRAATSRGSRPPRTRPGTRGTRSRRWCALNRRWPARPRSRCYRSSAGGRAPRRSHRPRAAPPIARRRQSGRFGPDVLVEAPVHRVGAGALPTLDLRGSSLGHRRGRIAEDWRACVLGRRQGVVRIVRPRAIARDRTAPEVR